ncbi:MAG TPA: hypothetical protein VLX32_10790 [Candidatus Acidoferrum sp.]|nr:hypothetical protein [Candidatus Acidoferrum sp.]
MRKFKCPLIALGVLALSAFGVSAPGASAQSCSGPGTKRWTIKTSLPPNPNVDNPKAIALPDLLALAPAKGVTNNDADFEMARIPAFPNSLNVKEGDIVRTTGWLYLVATEADCDYHIQISTKPRTTTDKPTPDDDCMVVEAPKPDFVDDADLKQRTDTVRNYIKTKMLRNKEPSTRGSVMIHAVCVRVSGQLFYDDSHLKTNGDVEPRGKKGLLSHTLWELHPITDFKIIPSSSCPS